MLHFHMTEELRDALHAIYVDLLWQEYDKEASCFRKQLGSLSLEGVFGEHDQEFEGLDAVDLFFSGRALRELLESLGSAN